MQYYIIVFKLLYNIAFKLLYIKLVLIKNKFGKETSGYMKNSILLRKLCPKTIEQQYNIYDGLCSKYSFEKIIEGEKKVDILLLRGILQRLGKSTENLEILLQEKDYIQIEYEEMIECFIEEGRYKEAEEKIVSYERDCKESENLKQQKIHQWRAEIFFNKKGYKISYDEVEMALNCTKRNLRRNETIWELPMTMTEIQLHQQRLELEYLLGNTKQSQEEAKKLERALLKFVTDKELLVKVYPRAISFLANHCYQTEGYERCLFYCKKGIDILRWTDSLLYGIELFRLQANAMKEGKLGSEKERKQADFEAYAMESLYNEEIQLDEVVEKEIGEELWEFI